MKFKSIIIILLSLACLNLSCDDTIEFDENYILVWEGKGCNGIMCHKGVDCGVPCDVLAYNYDDDFIIVAQLPNETDQPLDRICVYSKGRKYIYYWLIIPKKNIELGPLTKEQFEEARKTYKVPEDMEFISL